MMRKAHQADRALHEHDDFEVDAEMVTIFEQTMQNDPRALRRLTAGQLAALTQLLQDELAQLQAEGMAQFVPMLDADGAPLLDEDGEVILRTVSNPRKRHGLTAGEAAWRQRGGSAVDAEIPGRSEPRRRDNGHSLIHARAVSAD